MRKKILACAALLMLAAGIAAWILLRPSDDGVLVLRPYYRNSTVGGFSIYDDPIAGSFATWDGVGWVTNREVYAKDRLPLGNHDNHAYIEARTLDERDDYVNCVISLHEPRDSGRQRVLLNFRERFTVGEDENGNPLYTSGNEVYAIFFEFDIPEPNGEPYEVVHAVDATERGNGETMIYTLVRRNADFGGECELPYVDDDGIVLEKLEDGEWSTVRDASIATMTTAGNGYTMPLYFSTKSPERLDSSATYRITLPLSELPNGEGRTYDLQFSFRFAK